MKKIILISAVFSVVTIASLFLACQKQELEMDENQSTENFDPTLNKILKFQESLKSADAKNNTFLSIDSAVWYIEALLNYNYCVIKDSSAAKMKKIKDSVLCSINVTEGKVKYSDIIVVYYEIEKKILDNKNSTNLIDVYYENNKFKFLQIIEIENNFKNYGNFNGFTEEYYFTEADDLIEEAANNYIKWSLPYGSFSTDIETVSWIWPRQEFLRNPNSNNPYSMYYYLFYRPSSGGNSGTLTVEEMNFYYYGVFTAADLVKTQENINSQKRIKYIDLMDDFMPCTNCEILHWGFFTYASYITLPEPPSNN